MHRSISRSRHLVGTSIVLLLVMIIAAAGAVWALRQDATTDTQEDNHRLGVVIAEEITRSFQGVDIALREMTEKIVNSGVHDLAGLQAGFGGRDVHDALVARLTDLPQAAAFGIIDADGHNVNLSRQWPVPTVLLTNRGYFQHFARAPDPGLFISEPIISRSSGGKPTLALARRLTASDGTFLGVVYAGVQLGYFEALFERTGFSDGTEVTILRNDGTFLVHYPEEKGISGAIMPSHSPWYDAVLAAGGYYRSPGITGTLGGRLVSVHPLSAYPIVVDVLRLESAAFARWRRQAIAIGAGVICVTLGFALLLRALTRQITIIEKARVLIHAHGDAAVENEARLLRQSALLETTLEHMDQGLLVVDASGIVAVCNRRAAEILELPRAMMAAHPPFADLVGFQMRQGEFTGLAETQADLGLHFNDQAMYERRRPNGTVLEVRTAAMPGGGIVRTYTDVTARTVAEEMLESAASHDQLTGLANRNGFNAKREAALTIARRNKTELAVLCLDLDRFKAVNDTLGHGTGDELLIAVAQRMRDAARDTDELARLGGDEFAILLPDTDLSGAERMSLRLLEAIRLPYAIGPADVRIGVSIGIAIFPSDGDTAEELLRNADAALYKAKAAGRDTWRAYSSEYGQRQHDRMALELDVRAAVEARQFTLVYQPICDAATSSPVAFEALVRWNHPTRGAVSPAEFIPIAEQSGLIIPLGRWILETACAEAAAWARPVRLSVNLSPAQFRERELVSFVRGVLARTGLAAGRLDLEVTEGLLIEDGDAVVDTMEALRAMGVRMVLDDFGTANSNLSYLRRFPFEVVKIDQSFMRALNTDRQARALVEAILGMARALGLEVVGEGVETAEQLTLLRHLQCRLVQGYFLGRPAPASETRDMVWNLAWRTADNQAEAVG